jgi:signal transduction histidine kinase
VTPDAVLHRYLELVSGQDIDTAVLYDLVSTDADLLNRWVVSLGCSIDPAAIRHGLERLHPRTLAGLAKGQIWAVTPLGSAARLGFDQWRSVLRASCVAEALAAHTGYDQAEPARLRILLAMSGISVSQDSLMTELAEFRGAPAELLLDAHPVLRTFSVVEALEHQSVDQARRLAEVLFDLDAVDFDRVREAADQRCDTLVSAARLTDEVDDTWREQLWIQAQLAAFSNVMAREPGDAELLRTSSFVSRGLFNQLPRCFVLEDDRATLVAVGSDDLAALRIPVGRSGSGIARALRDHELIEITDAPDVSVVDRQVLRRLDAERVLVVPMIDGQERVGVVVFRLNDDDRSDTVQAMRGFADELAQWLHARRHEEVTRIGMMADYRMSHEKRLRELVHEANNPLSIIHNYLHILELRLQDQPETHEQLRLIADEIRRTADIVKRVVEFPPLESERTPATIERQRFDLNDLARRVLELAEGQAAPFGIDVHTSLMAGGVEVGSDRDRVAQVLTNLVKNAIEAMPDGGVLQVETLAPVYRSGRPGVEMVIRDDGPGLPPHVLDKLYEPKESGKGEGHAGLGLHITSRLVAELEGAIDVRTSARGTAFSVFLPDLV